MQQESSGGDKAPEAKSDEPQSERVVWESQKRAAGKQSAVAFSEGR